MNPAVSIPREALADFCRRHGIRRLAVFGSALRGDFRPESDIDMLVEFHPDRIPGLLGMARIERELSALLGRKVDLRTPGDLSRYFRERVLAEAEVQYASAPVTSGPASDRNRPTPPVAADDRARSARCERRPT